MMCMCFLCLLPNLMYRQDITCQQAEVQFLRCKRRWVSKQKWPFYLASLLKPFWAPYNVRLH